MGDPQVFWDGGPAPLVGDQLPPRILSVAAGATEYVRLLAEPQRVRTHWISDPHLRPKGRTRPCTGRDCEHCEVGSVQELKAYAAALRWVRDPLAHLRKGGRGGTWDRVVAEFPTEAWHQLAAEVLARVPEGGEPQWRGVVVELTRPGKKHNGRVRARIFEKQLTDPVPEAFDVKPILLRVWSIRPRVLPAEPPAAQESSDGIIPFRRKGGA